MVAHNWQEKAECRKHSVSLFYPDVKVGDAYAYKRTINEARKVCLECPVAKECYDCAVANDEQFGVWGGVNFHRNTHVSPHRHAERVRAERIKFLHSYNARAVARLRDKALNKT